MPVTRDDDPVELNLSAATLRDILLKARVFDLEEFPDEPDPGEEPVPAQDRETILEGGVDGTEAELAQLIDDLNEDEIVDLIAIVWVGRGDFSRDEWPAARALARERHTTKSSGYLMGMPTLPDYLAEGLEALGHSVEELEDM